MEVVLYTKAGCHLCEVARQAIEPFREEFGFTFRVISLESDPALRERYALNIPVILLDGREVARHKVSPGEFRRKLEEARASEIG
jgi:glutaredoxin